VGADKVTIGVTYEGALGKPASSSPLARSAVAREPFQAGQNTGRRNPAPRKTRGAAFCCTPPGVKKTLASI
jgi:hypothetical protein